MKTKQTKTLKLKGPSDISIVAGGQQWLYVPVKHFGFDDRFKNCRLYKVLVEFQDDNRARTADLFDIPVTFLDWTDRPVEIHAKYIVFDNLGSDAYKENP